MSNRESLAHSQEDVAPHPASEASHRASELPARFYQTQFSDQLSSVAHPAPELSSVSLEPAFHGSRPDPLPPRLHPANNPTNPLLTNNLLEPILNNIPPSPLPIPQTPLPTVFNSISAKQHQSPGGSFQRFKSFKPASINTNLKPFPPFKHPSLAHSAPSGPQHVPPQPQHQVAHHQAPVVHHHSSIHHPSPVHHHPHHSPIHRPPLFSHLPPPLLNHLAPVHAPTPPPYSPPPHQSLYYDPFEFQQRLNKSTTTANQLEPVPPAPRKPPPPPSPPQAPAPPVIAPIPLTPVLSQPTPGPGAPPLTPTPFPPVILQPIPGLPLLPPSSPPGSFDEDFPEYDAVPSNLGPLIPGFIPIQRNSIQLSENSSGDVPSDFLFNANLGFGLPTSERVRKRNTNKSEAVAGITNSHGGPIKGSLSNKKCKSTRSDIGDHIRLLQKTFPRCVTILDQYGIQNNDTKKLANFGTCLNSKSVSFEFKN